MVRYLIAEYPRRVQGGSRRPRSNSYIRAHRTSARVLSRSQTAFHALSFIFICIGVVPDPFRRHKNKKTKEEASKAVWLRETSTRVPA